MADSVASPSADGLDEPTSAQRRYRRALADRDDTPPFEADELELWGENWLEDL